MPLSSVLPSQIGIRPPSLVVNPFSYEALSEPRFVNAAAAASAVYPTANLSILYPFSVSESITAVKMYWINGAAVSGNIDIGIYDDVGTLLVSSGSTAQATINVKQEVNTTDLALLPGKTYYNAIACDNGTGTMFRWAPAAPLLAAMGVASVAANFPLATGVTFALMATAYLPIFGYSQLVTF